MIKVKKYVGLLCAMLSIGALVASCSSEEEMAQGVADGKGRLKLALNVGTDFQTRAINESDYTNLANYKVQILKDGRVVDGCEWAGDAIPNELIELTNGTYTVLAFTGEEHKGVGATTKGMYVEGRKSVDIDGVTPEVKTVEVNCTPQCARVTVGFDEKMNDYFNNYYVTFTGTKALASGNFTWEKTATDPVYMAVSDTEQLTATIHLVDKDNRVVEGIVRTKEVTAGKAWKLTVTPKVKEGSIGITIEINGETNDCPIDIEIPSDWV